MHCSAAKAALSLHLCEALISTNSVPVASSGEGTLPKATSKVTNLAGKFVCTTAQTVPFNKKLEVRNAKQRKILMVEPCRKRGPSPVLIIDEFYINSENNKAFVQTLLRDAAGMSVTVFLMTNNADQHHLYFRLVEERKG